MPCIAAVGSNRVQLFGQWWTMTKNPSAAPLTRPPKLAKYLHFDDIVLALARHLRLRIGLRLWLDRLSP